MTVAVRRGLVALVGVALLVGHVILLHRMSSRIALPMEVMLAALTVFVLVHLGVVRTLIARFRRRSK
jgi:hypothetical protein